MKQYFFRNFLILLLLTFSFFSARAIHAFADHYTSDDKSITIVIDPGHGGPDPGKISPSGILEKDINLQISSTLKMTMISHLKIQSIQRWMISPKEYP